LQSLYINMGRYYVPGNDSEKKVSFKFLIKCRQCHWWRHFWRKTVPGFCRRNKNLVASQFAEWSILENFCQKFEQKLE